MIQNGHNIFHRIVFSLGMIDETAIGERYRALAGELDERRRRLWAAAAARATGMAENTIRRGLRELETGERRPGAGRTPVTTADPTLRADLERLVDTQSRGDPESPLRWTAKSVRRLRDELRTGGHRVSHETVARLLRGLGYSLQANRKGREGTAHPDRDAQFQHLNTTATRALDAGEPVISVDTKKKELVGDFKNGGREWRPKGSPEPVRVHDAEGPGARQGDSLWHL
jgi:transposase